MIDTKRGATIHGSTAYCYACAQAVDAWAEGPGGRPNASCPHCGALERHRFLAYLLELLDPVVRRSRIVLDIAPQTQIQGLLQARVGHRYIAMDRDGRLPVDLVADLRQLPLAPNSVDLAICYHVLEHVPDDGAAIRQLARVLDRSGLVLIQVPQRAHAPTIEDPEAPVEVRIRKFGQADHVRYYGGDFAGRLADHGLNFLRIDPTRVLDEAQQEHFGVAPEPVWICQPADAQPASGLEDLIQRTLANWSARPVLPVRAKRRANPLRRRLQSLIRKILP